jgi:hypothetical protein
MAAQQVMAAVDAAQDLTHTPRLQMSMAINTVISNLQCSKDIKAWFITRRCMIHARLQCSPTIKKFPLLS